MRAIKLYFDGIYSRGLHEGFVYWRNGNDQHGDYAGGRSPWLGCLSQGIADALGVELKPYHVASEFLAAVSDFDLTGSLLGDKANSVVFDNSKLKRAVPGFHSEVRFDQGVRRAVDYILRHPECQVEDPEFDAWCDRVIESLEAAKKAIR